MKDRDYYKVYRSFNWCSILGNYVYELLHSIYSTKRHEGYHRINSLKNKHGRGYAVALEKSVMYSGVHLRFVESQL